jgi:formate hydrogenlyase subunit 3/multisubunit Na+/H+ antiporter MnhD subunit
VGFLMNFSVVLELATFVAFAVVLLGGRSNRDNGWKMCVGLSAVVVVCQITAMGIVVSFSHRSATWT